MNGIKFDPKDLKGMRRLMDDHGNSKTMKAGVNENGENVTISISVTRLLSQHTKATAGCGKTFTTVTVPQKK